MLHTNTSTQKLRHSHGSPTEQMRNQGLGRGTDLTGQANKWLPRCGLSCTQGTRRPNQTHSKSRTQPCWGEGDTKYTQMRVTPGSHSLLWDTGRCGSQPVYLPPLLLLPGDKSEVAKLAVAGRGRGGGIPVPSTLRPGSSHPVPKLQIFLPRDFGKAREIQAKGTRVVARATPHPQARTSPARERTQWWTLTPALQVVRARQSRGRRERAAPVREAGLGAGEGRPPRQSAGDRQQLPPPP